MHCWLRVIITNSSKNIIFFTELAPKSTGLVLVKTLFWQFIHFSLWPTLHISWFHCHYQVPSSLSTGLMYFSLSALLEAVAITVVPFKLHCPLFMSSEIWVLLYAAVGYSWLCLHIALYVFLPSGFVTSGDSFLEWIAVIELPPLLAFSSEELHYKVLGM